MKNLIYLFAIVLTLPLLFACKKKEGPTIEERKEAQLQGYKDQLANEKRTAYVTDSLLQVLLPQINEKSSALFDFEKTEYDDLGHFTPKGMDPGVNVERTYLHSSVDEYGKTQLIATRCGGKSFAFTKICVKSSDGTMVETNEVPLNADNNYQYDIDDKHYQSVTFVNSDVLAFIAAHAEDKGLSYIMIDSNNKEQSGGRIAPKERQGMAATYELGVMLAESIRLQQENKTAAGKVLFLQEVIERKESQKSASAQ